MHELAIAIRMVESLEEHLKAQSIETDALDLPTVRSVTVRVGALAGVVPDALQFAWGPATKDTHLHDSQLLIDYVPVWIDCPNCGQVELPGIQAMRCPICVTPAHNIIRGRELEILSMEVHHDNNNNSNNNNNNTSPHQQEALSGSTS